MKRLPVLLLTITALSTAHASTRDDICKSGVLQAGVKTDSPPFGFLDAQSSNTGFDIDLLREITKDLSASCKKTVKLVLKPVTAKNRIEFIQNGTIDVAAATATITYARLDVVDFTNPYFLDGVRILTKAGSSVQGLRDLQGKRVGTVQGTTGENVVKTQGKGINLTSFQQYSDAFTALSQGRIEAIVTDSTILLGLKMGASNPKAWAIVGPYLSQEPYGLIIRQNDSRWRNFLNESLSRMNDDGTYRKLIRKWFGKDSEYEMSGLKTSMTLPFSFPVRR